MSIPNTGAKKVRPIHPGEMLREDFLPDYGLSVSGLAELRLHCHLTGQARVS